MCMNNECESCEDDGYGFCEEGYFVAAEHVIEGEFTGIGADVWFLHGLTEIVVGSAETASEDGGEGGLRPSAVGRCVGGAVAEDETETRNEK